MNEAKDRSNCLHCLDSGSESICRKCVWFNDDNNELFLEPEEKKGEKMNRYSIEKENYYRVVKGEWHTAENWHTETKLNKADNYIKELEKQNEELINFLIISCNSSIEMWKDNCYENGETFSFQLWAELNHLKVSLLEKTTGKPIEEILKQS